MRFLVVLILACAPSFAAVAHVKSDQGKCDNTSSTNNMSGTCNAVSTKTFTFTPTNANDLVLIFVGCSGTTETTVSLSATSWTFTKISGPDGASGGWGASFWAISPNTSAATITATWSGSCGSSPSQFLNDLIDEFSGTDTSTPIDASNKSNGTATNCGGTSVANVTPTVNNDGLWGACNDSVSAVGGSYTKGADDGVSDWSEWKILSGGSGTAQGFTYTGSSGAYVLETVAIKPASATKTCTIALMGAGAC